MIMGVLILPIMMLVLAITSHVKAREKQVWLVELLPNITVALSMPLAIHHSYHANFSVPAHAQSQSLQLRSFYFNQLATSKHNEYTKHLEADHKCIPFNLAQHSIPPGYHQFCLNRNYSNDHIPMIDGHPLEPIIAFQQLTGQGGKINF